MLMNLIYYMIQLLGKLKTKKYHKRYEEQNPIQVSIYDDKINDKINDKIKMLLDVLKSNPKATIPELSQKVGISSASVSRYLKQLQEEKIIEYIFRVRLNIQLFFVLKNKIGGI